MSPDSYIYNGEGGNRRKPKEYAMVNNIENVNNEQNILLNDDIRRQMAVLMGGKKDKNLELTPQQRKAIVKNYIGMYYALAAMHWCAGKSLGVAWQKALDLMNSFVAGKAKTLNNPVNKYLVGFHAQHRRAMSEFIITSPNSGDIVNLSAEDRKIWSDFATKRFHGHMDALNDLHRQFETEQKEEKVAFDTARQKIKNFMMNLMQQKQSVK